MSLKKVTLKNFRTCHDVELNDLEHLTVLMGRAKPPSYKASSGWRGRPLLQILCKLPPLGRWNNLSRMVKATTDVENAVLRI